MEAVCALRAHFNRFVWGEEAVVESQVHKVARRCLNAVAVIVGVGGKVPYFSSSLKYAGSNLGYGIALVVGSGVAWSIFSSYCLLQIVKRELRPLSVCEQGMARKQRPLSRLAEVVVLLAVAVFSQYPLGYLCYVNNGNQVVYMVITLIDSASSFYSLILSSNAFHEKRLFAGNEELLRKRECLIGRIENYREGLVECWNGGEVAHNSDAFFEGLGAARAREGLPWWAKLVGGIFSVSQLAMFAMPTYYGMRRSGASEGVGVTMAIGVVLINAYLMSDFLMKSVYHQCKKVEKIFTRTVQPTLASLCYPWKRRVLSMVDVGCSALAYGVAGIIARDYFPKGLSEVQEYVSIVGTFFLLTHLLEPTFDGILLQWARRKSVAPVKEELLLEEGNRKRILEVDEKLGEFEDSLRDALPQEVEKFIESLPQGLKTQLEAVYL